MISADNSNMITSFV